MSGTFARDDQPRTPFAYESDNGTGYYILMEAKYAGASGLVAITGTPTVPLYPYSHKKLRHIYIRTTEDGPTAGRLHSRRVPCKNFTGQLVPIPGDIDGLSDWKWGAQHGEVVPL